MAVLQNNILAGAAGSGGAADAFAIKQSLRFDESSSSRLDKTFQATGNQTTWTWSGWFKRGKNDHYSQLFTCSTASNNYTQVYVENTGQFVIANNTTAGGNRYLVSTKVLRDPTAWYHLVAVHDTNNATTTDRMRLYVNGERITEFSNTSYPNSGTLSNINSTNQHSIGSVQPLGTNGKLDGYLAEVHFVDGQALEPTDFGEPDPDTGVWNPIEFTGNHNTAGVTHWRQADSSDAPSGDNNAQNYRTQRAFEDPQPTALVWDHQATETIGLQNITGITSLRLKLNSVGNAKLAINGGALFSVGNHGTSTSYPPSESQASWYTISNPPSTLTSISATGGGSGTGNWASVWAIEVNGNRVVDTPAGVNGFHLDFDPTAGATYSDGVSSTSTANSSYPATNGFDGNAGSSGTANWYTQGSNQTITVDLSSYNLTASSSVGFNVRLGGPGNSATVSVTATIGGTAYTQTFQNSSTQDQLLTFNGSGAVTTIVATLTQASSSYGWGFTGVQVDGSYLVNNEAPGVDASGNGNHWTATNLADSILLAGNGYNGSLNGYMPSGVAQATDPSQLASTSNRTHFFLVNQDNSVNITVVATATSITTGSSVYDSWGANNPTTTLNNGTVTPNSSGTDTSVSGKNLATNTFTGLTVGNTYTISTKNGGAGNPHRIHYVTGATVQNQPVVDTNVLPDVPTNYDDGTTVGGNYATLNPLDNPDNFALSKGNLETTIQNSGGNSASSTFHMTTGKWFWENIVTWNGNDGGGTGIIRGGDSNKGHLDSASGIHANASVMIVDGTVTSQSPVWATYNTPHVIGHALDLDNGNIKFYLNGTLWTTVTLPSSSTGWKAHSNYGSAGGSMNCQYNFGQRTFAYAPPAGYKTLCTPNLDTPLIEDGSEHFDAVLWTGNGALKKIGGGDSASAGLTATGTGGVSGINSSYPITGVFDGSTSTYLATNAANISSNPAVLTVTFPSGNQPSYSSSVVLEVWAGTADTVQVAINGGSYQTVSASSNDWQSHTVATGSGTITEIKVSRQKGNTNNGAAELRSITVDGVQLLDGTSKSLEFSPDFVWSKTRSHTQNHFLFDTVRGAGRSMRINTSSENGPNTGNDGDLISFNSDGFTVGAGNASGAGAVNNLNQTQVAWSWDGGDLVTNSAYNQSEVWSNSITNSSGGWDASYPITNAFNSVISGANTARSSNTAITTTFAPATGISYSTSVEVWTWYTGTVSLNGGTAVSVSDDQNWRTIHSGSGTLNTLAFVGNSGNNVYIAGIRVDGKILVDAGLVPVGGLNSSLYNQTQNWTSNISSTSGINAAHASRLFNGILTGSGADIQSSSNGVNGAINFTNAITGSKIEIFTLGNVGQIGINGNNLTVTSLQWVDTGVTSLTSVETRCPGAGYVQNPCGLRVDGKILVDSNQTPPNFPVTPATVRANKPAGFSIISFESPGSNTNIPHGLNQKPEFVFTKLRNASINTNWCVFHKDLASDAHVLALDSSYYQESNPTTFNSTAPDSAVIYLGTRGSVSESGKDGIAYAFHSVDGFSKFGTYNGSGNSEGPFIYLGFRPAMFMMKNINGTFPWVIADSIRNTYNYMGQHLYPNLTDGEGTRTSNDAIDFLSNGVKIRAGGSNSINQNATFVYAAWAENPFKISRAR